MTFWDTHTLERNAYQYMRICEVVWLCYVKKNAYLYLNTCSLCHQHRISISEWRHFLFAFNMSRCKMKILWVELVRRVDKISVVATESSTVLWKMFEFIRKVGGFIKEGWWIIKRFLFAETNWLFLIEFGVKCTIQWELMLKFHCI